MKEFVDKYGGLQKLSVTPEEFVVKYSETPPAEVPKVPASWNEEVGAKSVEVQTERAAKNVEVQTDEAARAKVKKRAREVSVGMNVIGNKIDDLAAAVDAVPDNIMQQLKIIQAQRAIGIGKRSIEEVMMFNANESDDVAAEGG